MIIQIFGFKNCRNTQKAIRFFKERSIGFQFINLDEKKISKGELSDICKHVPATELINKECREYKRLNLKYISYDSFELLLDNPKLVIAPIIRGENFAIAGYEEDKLKMFVKK